MLVLALVGLATVATAQNEVPVKKHSVTTNSFWANWYVSGGLDLNATYSSQEKGVNKNPFSEKRGNIGFNVAVGKWFTPSIGLRTKFNGVWGRQVNTENSHPLYLGVRVHEDIMFNLTNMFCGYKENRLYNIIPYVGVGFAKNFDLTGMEFSYNIGFVNNFRLNKRFSLFADIYASAMPGNNDGIGPNNVDKTSWRYWDIPVGVTLGVTYNIGKCGWSNTPDVDALMAMNKAQVDALNASLDEQQTENGRLRELLAKKKEAPVTNTVEKIVTKPIVATASSVFFNIGSARIASRKDLVNVKEVVEYVKKNGGKIVVTGYADSKTGTASYNQTLSEKRANAVANELVKMGVSRDNLEIVGKGGVNNLTPFSYNRRVTIEVK